MLGTQCSSKLLVFVCEPGGDGPSSGGDPARPPVGCQSPLRFGSNRPALQWATTSLWCHQHCHPLQEGLPGPNQRPAAAPRRGQSAETSTLRVTQRGRWLWFCVHWSFVVFEQALRWCDEGAYLLASQMVDKFQTREGAQEALQYLSSHQERSPSALKTSEDTLSLEFEAILTPQLQVTGCCCHKSVNRSITTTGLTIHPGSHFVSLRCSLRLPW